MIPEQQGFLTEVLANPQDDGVRLIFADWLEENGDSGRAELIRLSCELARVPNERDQAELRLRLTNAIQQLSSVLAALQKDWMEKVVTRRGFIEEITCTGESWLKHADVTLREHPLQVVRLTTDPPLSHNDLTARFQPARWEWWFPGRDRVRLELDLHSSRKIAVQLLRANWPRLRFFFPGEEE